MSNDTPRLSPLYREQIASIRAQCNRMVLRPEVEVLRDLNTLVDIAELLAERVDVLTAPAEGVDVEQVLARHAAHMADPEAAQVQVMPRSIAAVQRMIDQMHDAAGLARALLTTRAELAAMTAERDRLAERLEDFDDDRRKVMAETCAPDEKHCSCVPHLRRRIADVERDLFNAQHEATVWKSKAHSDAVACQTASDSAARKQAEIERLTAGVAEVEREREAAAKRMAELEDEVSRLASEQRGARKAGDEASRSILGALVAERSAVRSDRLDRPEQATREAAMMEALPLARFPGGTRLDEMVVAVCGWLREVKPELWEVRRG